MFRDMCDAGDTPECVCDALAKFCFQGAGTHRFHGPDIDCPPIPVAGPANHLLLPIGDPACSDRADFRLAGFPEPFFEDLGSSGRIWRMSSFMAGSYPRLPTPGRSGRQREVVTRLQMRILVSDGTSRIGLAWGTTCDVSGEADVTGLVAAAEEAGASWTC
jgi:hypothetical protein